MNEEKKPGIRVLTVAETFAIEAETEARKADGSVTVDYRARQLKLLAKATGKTEAEIEALPMPEFKDLVEKFAEAHMSRSEKDGFLRARKRMEQLSA